MVRCESLPSTISPINLGMKQTGAPSAGNPHAGCDVAGAGNGFTVWLLRHSQRKRGATARLDLRNTAPVLDPTSMATGISKATGCGESALRSAFLTSTPVGAGFHVIESVGMTHNSHTVKTATVKDLFDSSLARDTKQRIMELHHSQPLWGNMTVARLLRIALLA